MEIGGNEVKKSNLSTSDSSHKSHFNWSNSNVSNLHTKIALIKQREIQRLKAAGESSKSLNEVMEPLEDAQVNSVKKVRFKDLEGGELC